MKLVLESHTDVSNTHFLRVLSHDDDSAAVVSAITVAALSHRSAHGIDITSVDGYATRMLFALVARLVLAPIPIRQRWLTGHELREPRHITRPVNLVQSARNLCVLRLFVVLEKVQLRVHPVDKLLLLVVHC